MAFVLDASAAMAWCFEDEMTDGSRALLDRLQSESAIVPSLFLVEVSNILVVACRRGRITETDSSQFVDLLLDLDLRVDGAGAAVLLNEVRVLARSEGLSAYDAAYLELARRESLALATRDTALAAAARRIGVDLLPA